ncbi:MAG: hypothetical protein Q4P33_06940 [Flaviflexus sp.]|nr:hypothetical protein [Flaviflexus sp.]
MGLLWWRKKEELPEPVPIEVDAQIDWLGKRGLGPAPGLSRREWMAAAEDPTDPFSLAEATIDGRPCASPNLIFAATGEPPTLIENMAEALDLPIDEATVDGGILTVRSARQFFTYEITNASDLAEQVARDFVDAGHILRREGHLLAIMHRDVACVADSLAWPSGDAPED